MGRIKEVVLDTEESMTVAFKKEQRMSLAPCWVKRSFDKQIGIFFVEG